MADNVQLAGAYAVSPWALCHDDGASVLAVDTHSCPRREYLVQDRTLFTSTLQQLAAGAELTGAQEVLVRTLVDSGILQDLSQETQPSYSSRPLEVEVQGCGSASLAAVQELCGVVREDQRSAIRLTLIAGHEKAGEIDTMLRALRGTVESASLLDRVTRWELSVATSVDGTAQLLDAHDEVQLVVRDVSEVDTGWDVEGAHQFVRGLSGDGFSVVVNVVSRLGPSLPGRISKWLESNDGAGVRIHPLLWTSYYGCPCEGISTASAASDAVQTIHRIGMDLGIAASRSEPWASIAAHANTSGRLRDQIDRSRVVFVASDGRIARSHVHAAEGLWESPASILAARLDRVWLSTTHPAQCGSMADLPKCEECALAPICNRYWTPEIDLLIERGRGDTAGTIAGLLCGIRECVLSALVMQWHVQARSRIAAGTTTVAFAHGQVTFQHTAAERAAGQMHE